MFKNILSTISEIYSFLNIVSFKLYDFHIFQYNKSFSILSEIMFLISISVMFGIFISFQIIIILKLFLYNLDMKSLIQFI